MATYIALLRAVNVGGRVVKMAELARVFEAMDFAKVQTYIQSGNVLFAADERADEDLHGGPDEGARLLGERIERTLEAAFGFPVAVLLRTPSELERIIAQCPFAAEAASQDKRLYVAALSEPPTQEGVDRLRAGYDGEDEWRIVDRELYLLYHHGAGESKLTTAFLERRLGITATARNWRTITTLARLGRAMEDA